MPTRGKQNLSQLEQRFVQALVLGRPGVAGRGAKAAIEAGYAPKAAASQASRLLTRVNVLQAIKTLKGQRLKQDIASARERDLVATAILRDPLEDSLVRLAAIKELNRVERRHSERHVHEGRLTLAEALEQVAGLEAAEKAGR